MSVMVITGGSRGIGRATVLGAAARGWDVAFSYVSDEAAAGSTAEIARAAGVRCEVLKGDARDEAHLAALFDLGASLGPVDKCVVNAGIIDQAMPLAEMEADRIARVVDVNVTGALLTAREESITKEPSFCCLLHISIPSVGELVFLRPTNSNPQKI